MTWNEATRTAEITDPSLRRAFVIHEYDGMAATALEFIAECDSYRYYLSSSRSNSIMLVFEDGTSMSLRMALTAGQVTIHELVENGLHVIRNLRSTS